VFLLSVRHLHSRDQNGNVWRFAPYRRRASWMPILKIAFRRRRKCALMSGDDAMDIDTAKSVENEEEKDYVYLRVKL